MITETLERPAVESDRIKLAVRGLYDAQKLRIQLSLRIQRLVRDGIMEEDEAKTFFKLPFSWFEKAEHEMQKLVVRETKNLPIVKSWLLKVRGVGPRIAGLMVANIAPIERFPNVAKLWAYAGLAVKDGRAVKREKGQKSNWNQELKTTAWKLAQSFVKQGGAYRDVYDRYKSRIIERETNKGSDIYHQVNGKWKLIDFSQAQVETHDQTASHDIGETQRPAASQSTRENHSSVASQNNLETQDRCASQAANETQAQIAIPKSPEWTLGRINNMALRYTAKMFLSHLWQVWREMEGLETRLPYPVEYLGHTTILDPWDFIEDQAKR